VFLRPTAPTSIAAPLLPERKPSPPREAAAALKVRKPGWIKIKPAARRSRDKTLGVTAVVFGPILSGTQEIRKVLFGSSFPDFLISRFKPSFPAEVMFVHEHLSYRQDQDYDQD
jgi:hypothetical protein